MSDLCNCLSDLPSTPTTVTDALEFRLVAVIGSGVLAQSGEESLLLLHQDQEVSGVVGEVRVLGDPLIQPPREITTIWFWPLL
jgi:hypothetical protein